MERKRERRVSPPYLFITKMVITVRLPLITILNGKDDFNFEFSESRATLVYKLVYQQHLVQNLAHNRYSNKSLFSEEISILRLSLCHSFQPHNHPMKR